MASLVDQIRQQGNLLGAAPAPAGAGTAGAGATQSLVNLQQAGQRAKRGLGSTTAASSEDEQAALKVASLQSEQQEQEGEAKAQAIAQTAAQQDQANLLQAQTFEQRQINARTELSNKAQDIWTQASQQFEALDQKKQASIATYLTTMARMSNQDYMGRLAAEAQKSRLSSAIRFDEALTESVFSSELELLRDDLTFKSALSADAREFNDYVASMDIESAIQLSAIQGQAASEQAKYAAIGSAITTVASTGSRYAEKQADAKAQAAQPSPTPVK